MRAFIASLFIVFGVATTSLVSSAAISSPVSAASCPSNYLGITTWYNGLTKSKTNCNLKSIGDQSGADMTLTVFIMKVALNVVAAGFGIAAYVAIFFIIKGGFKYMTSAGSSDGMASAKKAITNAVIGLVIVLLSAIIVNTIVGVI